MIRLLDQASGGLLQRCVLHSVLGLGVTWAHIRQVGRRTSQSNYLVSVVSLLGGASLSLLFALLYALSGALRFFQMVDRQVHARSSGVIGFLVLLIGFLLQFAGTLWQALIK
jgi:hypothetical protein